MALAIYSSGPPLLRRTLNPGLNLLADSLPGHSGFLAWPQESFPTAEAHAGLPESRAGAGAPERRESAGRAAPASSGPLGQSPQAGGCRLPVTRSVGRTTSRTRSRTARPSRSGLRRRTGPPRLRRSSPSDPGRSNPGRGETAAVEGRGPARPALRLPAPSPVAGGSSSRVYLNALQTVQGSARGGRGGCSAGRGQKTAR